ncbi:uncharacterized protein B0H18DRAFT_1123793 [Fomitopsis serialis]|uniref:uncharacterized protein n=1 Tax=Fomitopsis serialis TaxID=139415 RepID=UPI002007982A|nr:uncharacterized protein B0H18DRAFT_1123793 [Neoantrodia serialis]KAH9917200.1 hypothetical protein B0H18DRAFT_1123793 [Neoantrodia serialis]
MNYQEGVINVLKTISSPGNDASECQANLDLESSPVTAHSAESHATYFSPPPAPATLLGTSSANSEALGASGPFQPSSLTTTTTATTPALAAPGQATDRSPSTPPTIHEPASALLPLPADSDEIAGATMTDQSNPLPSPSVAPPPAFAFTDVSLGNSNPTYASAPHIGSIARHRCFLPTNDQSAYWGTPAWSDQANSSSRAFGTEPILPYGNITLPSMFGSEFHSAPPTFEFEALHADPMLTNMAPLGPLLSLTSPMPLPISSALLGNGDVQHNAHGSYEHAGPMFCAQTQLTNGWRADKAEERVGGQVSSPEARKTGSTSLANTNRVGVPAVGSDTDDGEATRSHSPIERPEHVVHVQSTSLASGHRRHVRTPAQTQSSRPTTVVPVRAHEGQRARPGERYACGSTTPTRGPGDGHVDDRTALDTLQRALPTAPTSSCPRKSTRTAMVARTNGGTVTNRSRPDDG